LSEAALVYRSPRPLHISAARLQRALLWLLVFSGFLVIIEPSPYEVMFTFTATLFAVTGLTLDRRLTPLILLVCLYNLGGAFSLIPFITEKEPLTFTVVSFYLGVTSFFFAALMLHDTQQRLETIGHAWIWAGVIAAIAGMIGYFNVGGTEELFTKYGRASGTFKDPNVLGPFLAGPAIIIMQGFMSGTLKRPVLSLVAFLILMAGLFFSFSRGAWGVMAVSAAMTGFLLIVNGGSSKTRLRIVLIGIAGVLLLAALLAIVLSIDSVQQLFVERFKLVQDYDGGPYGRFGKLRLAVLMLLDRPNGIGPLHFEDFFPEAPHDVYVNAFSSYGWLGGLSYIAFIAATVWVGWANVWRKVPWQGVYITLWSSTFCQILQGFQIDTDHWRHLWMLFGLTWGIAIANLREKQARLVPPFADRQWHAAPSSA
jgi:hypothetical protein